MLSQTGFNRIIITRVSKKTQNNNFELSVTHYVDMNGRRVRSEAFGVFWWDSEEKGNRNTKKEAFLCN